MNDTPIIAGEDLLRIYSEVEGFTGKYACLAYDMEATSPSGERIGFVRGTLVQIYPYMVSEAVDPDKWNGYGGAYMGEHYNVLHYVSIRAYYNNTLDEYTIWTNDRPIASQLDAHMSCMKGLDFMKNVFKIDSRITLMGKHLEDYLFNEKELTPTQDPVEHGKRTLKTMAHAFGGTAGFVAMICAFLVIGIYSSLFKMLACLAVFFLVCYLCVRALSKDGRATQAKIEEWERCNKKCIAQFEIINSLHGGEPFS